MTKFVYDFAEGNKGMKDLLGGKGANLAEMTNMGLAVPPGFTITTEACLRYLDEGGFPPGLDDETEEHLLALEREMGKTLGDADDPLLVSVRSGAKFSMPGMMDTVLNLGLNDDSVQGLAKQSDGDVRFAWDAYRRLVQMFGKIVMDVPGEAFEDALERAKEAKGEGTQDTDLDADDLKSLHAEFLRIFREHTGSDFPTDPREQLRLAIEAVFRSWNGRRARDYRRQNKIADDLGTAVNIVAMVFGNRGMDSGTGVAFTRNPSTGDRAPYGDYLPNAQGEDVVAATRCRWRSSRPSTRRPTPACGRPCRPSRTTTATCAISSSRSRRAGCGSCRPESGSELPSANGSWPTTCCRRGSSIRTRRSCASTPTGSRSSSSACSPATARTRPSRRD
jgi:pyruvate, orthophosphate dikinase